MTMRRKRCRYCGRAIDLREGVDGTWRPYDPDGALHDCPGRPAAGQARAAPPPLSGTRSTGRSTGRSPAPAWLAAVGVIGLLGWYLIGGRDARPPLPAPAPTRDAFAADATIVDDSAPPAAPRPTADNVTEADGGDGDGCAAFDNQVWAQSVYAQADRVDPTVDPDRDGLACEELPPGAAPALWTDRVPAGAEPVALRSTIDGDTITVVTADGRQESVRLVGVDTPETGQGPRPLECYGPEASDFTARLFLGVEEVWLERDVEDRDRFGRLLRDVWFERDGRVFLANEAIVRAGAGERYRDTPNRRYVDQLVAAEAFARDHGYGQWEACR